MFARPCYDNLMERRQDQQTAHIVDAAVDTALHCGYAQAGRELAEHGLQLRDIIRVLTKPAERREILH